MLKRIIGAILFISGISFYGWHLMKKGSEPHIFWALVGGAIILVGLWLILPTKTAGKEKGV